MTLPDPLADFATSRHPQNCALVTDFDGTLAPIVNDPARAAPLPASIDALRTLAAHLGLVAVVSGRPVGFLRARIPVDDVVLVGQYGLERLVGDRIELDARAGDYVGPVAEAAAQAERRWPALLIERKGDIAFTVHWRTAPRGAPSPGALGALAADFGLAMQPGRQACELRPQVPVDKGTSFYELARAYERRIFAGDDLGDLAAFNQVFGDPEHDVQPVRIAVRSSEAPPELLERADVIVDGPWGLAELLAELARVVSSGPRP